MASLLENLNIIKSALDDADAKPNIFNKKKFYDALKDDFRPRKEALEAALKDAVPSNAADVNGEVKDENGKTIAKVVDGVVVVL